MNVRTGPLLVGSQFPLEGFITEPFPSALNLTVLLLFLFFGMVNVLNLILLLLGTNTVCLLFRLWFIKKTLSQA